MSNDALLYGDSSSTTKREAIGSYLSSETYAGLVVVSLQVSGVIDLESSVPG